MRIIQWAGCLAVMAALVSSAQATVDPPVEIELLGPARAAVKGQIFTGQLRISSELDAQLSDLRVHGDGWKQLSLDVPAQFAVAKHGEKIIDFAVLPTNPDKFLTVEVIWNGVSIRKGLDLSREHFERVTKPGRWVSRPRPAHIPHPAAHSGAPAPPPAPRAESREPSTDEEGPQVPSKGRPIRVMGTLRYIRPDLEDIGVYGMTVDVYDHDDVGADDYCATGTTDADGNFDISFVFDDAWEDWPDIFLKTFTRNGICDVEDDTWIFHVYEWETGWVSDVHDTHDFDTMYSESEGDVPALHILTNIVRTWHWVLSYGYNTPHVEVHWPVDMVGASYNRAHERIKISAGSQWNEGTHSHEFGHHFLYKFANPLEVDYCNHFCDDDYPDDCSHCTWCEENEHDAMNEGFSDYLGRVIPDSYLPLYGVAASSRIGVGGIGTCWVDSTYHDPDITEGYIAAALVDIHDSDAATDDHAAYPGYVDVYTRGSNLILSTVDSVHPSSPMQFLLAYKAATGMNDREDLWETLMNCGFNIDEEDPPVVPLLASSSHTEGELSPDDTVDLFWLKPYDDASGIDEYFYSITPDAPSLPTGTDWVRTRDDIVYFTTDHLSPGSWYFNLRTVDRDNNWGDDYVSFGPILIREPDPCNLEFLDWTSWDYPVVASRFASNYLHSCTVSGFLPGNTEGTYYSALGTNSGESMTSYNVEGGLYIDADWADNYTWPPAAAGATIYKCNEGPIEVRGGRHMMHFKFDRRDLLAETDEYDNTWGKQYVWTPLELESNVIVTREPLPHIWDGLEHNGDTDPLYFNCDGLRLDNAGWWNAVAVWTTDAGYGHDNYDVRMHEVSGGPFSGFEMPLIQSTRSSGCVEAVIVNSNNIATDAYDVGVYYYGLESSSDFKAVQLHAPPIAFGFSHTFSWDADGFMRMGEVRVDPDEVGDLTITVSTDPPMSPVYTTWLNEDFVYGNLLDGIAEMVTDGSGESQIRIDVTEDGYHALVFYRDPKDGDDPVDVTVLVEKTRPDLKPLTVAGWHSPAVPRAADDGTTTSVPLPDTLPGDELSTYCNFALWNDSPTAVPDLDADMCLDGESILHLSYMNFPAYALSRVNWFIPEEVRGGRHTFALMIDPSNLVPEIYENNNAYGEQYIWEPHQMKSSQNLTRSAPPERTGGWDEILSGEPRWYNCDGLRLGDRGEAWVALAIMPRGNDNYDVRLHGASSGAKDGFDVNGAYSGWGSGLSDFVMVHYSSPFRFPQDAGVLNISGGTGDYVAENAVARTLVGSSGTFGPYTMAANQMLDLYEINLAAGLHSFRLKALGGWVDWGLSLHPNDVAFLSKSTVLDHGISWYHEGSQDEYFTAEIPAAGKYCVAVWKHYYKSLQWDGDYELSIYPGVTGVETPELLPTVTALTNVHPNPFNPRATIAFDLASPGAVEICVYDVAGARVRELLRGDWPAGRHTVVWNGRDDRGEEVSSGVYLARLRAGQVTGTKKMVLVR